MYTLLLALVLQGDPTKDAANIQGTWVIVSAVTDGKPVDDVKGRKITFKDGKATTSEDNDEATYKIDDRKRPKTIDLIGSDKKVCRGIYKLDGDKLRLCLPEEEDGPRPKDFTAKDGDKQMLIELKREKK